MNNQLVIQNISDISDIVELDSFYLYHPHDIQLDLDRNLVFATASNGINLIDYTNKSNLQLLSTYKNFTYSTFISLQEELLYIGAEDYGLQVVNVTDPSNPLLIGNWSDPVGDIGQVYICSDYAFVATRIPNPGSSPTYLDLKVLNISDPTNIAYVSTVDTGGTYNGGAPRAHINDLVYFNDHAFGLKILDFSNPFDVSVIGNFSDGGFYNDLELFDEEIVFLADDYFGLKVVNCSIVDEPFLLGTHELSWRTLRVAVNDPFVFIATLTGGVRILSLNPETHTITLFPLWLIFGIVISSTTLRLVFYRKKLYLLE